MNKKVERYTISAGRANIQSLLLVIPIALLGFALYYYWWGGEKIAGDLRLISDNFALALLILILGIGAHELIHGLSWMAAAGLNWNTIEFGFKLSALSPYAHCGEPMKVTAYRFGVIAPGLVLGLLPFLWGLVTGNGNCIWFGLIFTLAAGGDFLMLWIIRKIPASTYVKDHPKRVGCETVPNEGKK